MPVSNDELVEAILRPIDTAFKKEGLTPTYLAKLLKEETQACKTKTYHIKGTRIVVYSQPLIDWKTRQEARKDAHQIMGHYPVTKHKVDGIPESISVTFKTDFGTEDK